MDFLKVLYVAIFVVAFLLAVFVLLAIDNHINEGAEDMFYTDNPIADFDRWEAEQAREEANLPLCADCGETIYGHYYEIDGATICPDCLETTYRREADDY